jgi:hypothetical protein
VAHNRPLEFIVIFRSVHSKIFISQVLLLPVEQ